MDGEIIRFRVAENIMNDFLMKSFTATIQIIGINPYVLLPAAILDYLLRQYGKPKGQVPVKLLINKTEFIQTLVKYAGEWRLYLNTPMRKIAGKDVGDKITISIDYGPEERKTPIHPKLQAALQKNRAAKQKFDSLTASRQKEIARYINTLKSEESVDKNIKRAIGFLLEKERFIGRDKP